MIWLAHLHIFDCTHHCRTSTCQAWSWCNYRQLVQSYPRDWTCRSVGPRWPTYRAHLRHRRRIHPVGGIWWPSFLQRSREVRKGRQIEPKCGNAWEGRSWLASSQRVVPMSNGSSLRFKTGANKIRRVWRKQAVLARIEKKSFLNEKLAQTFRANNTLTRKIQGTLCEKSSVRAYLFQEMHKI